MGNDQEMNNFYFLVMISLVFLFPIIIFLLVGRKKAENGLLLPPGPFAWPIIGNIFNLDPNKPHISMLKLAESFGPLFSLKLGSRLFIIASNPTSAREIFKIHDRELSGRYIPQLTHRIPEVQNSVIALAIECNERWRFLRSIGHSELFSSQALQSDSQSRVKRVNKMLEFLNSKEGQLLKIADFVFATVANIVSRMMVSQDLVQNWSHSEKMQAIVRRLIDFGIPGLVDLYPLLSGYDFWSKKRAEDYMELNRITWGDFVRERRMKQKKLDDDDVGTQDFLDSLIKNSLNDNEIFNFLTEFFVSSESLTTLIEWAMTELMRNKEALTKLEDELAEAVDEQGRILRESTLTKLPYLQAFIKEVFRLHPPSPFLVPRSAIQTCEVMNYGIPKDTIVILNAYALGRDPKTWEDPLSFKPERFLKNNVDLKGTNYELLPFGGGRRVCAGYPLALKQIQLIIASLVHGFHWSLPHGTISTNIDMSEDFNITLRRKNPLLLIPKRKNYFVVE